MNEIKFVYFGGEPIGVPVLEELEAAGMLPSLVVCNPDRPVGRKQVMTPPPVKVWAEEHGIPVWQPDTFKDREAVTEKLGGFDLFVVVAYNKIMPKWLIEIPAHGAVNMHPSLLPLLRGASPIRSTILYDMRDACGVSVILLDEKMDHGPIIAQMKMDIAPENWPIRGEELDESLARQGGSLLAATLPRYLAGETTPEEQDHENATFCSRLDRSIGELTLDPHNPPAGDDAYQTLLKIRAFDGYPGTFFMYAGKRIKIKDAELADGKLRILRIVPEGKQEMDFGQYFSN